MLDHYRNPRNLGRLPRDAPDVGTGEAGVVEAGDLVRVQLRARAGRVDEIVFKAFGCTATLAAASLATERVRGGSLERAAALDAAELADALELAPEQRRSAELAAAAVRAAAADLPDIGDGGGAGGT